ncbi:MAG: type II and III secretion system protein family protein [Burkholderiales bacterium]|nr:type II and III secretion system protein family protein [Phycisphaerae bacterium]
MRIESNNNRSVLKQAIRWTAAVIAGSSSMALGADQPAAANTPSAIFIPAAQTAVALVDSGVDTNGRLELTANKTAVVTTKDKYKRFSVGQPEIADVTAVGPTTLLVTGKKIGTTQIIVWNEQEQSQVIDVTVTFDVQALRDEFKRMFPDAPIDVDVHNGQVSLKGRVASLKTAEQAQRVAEAYSKEVMNFLEVGGGQQISLGVQFLEVSRSASSELGFRSFFNDGKSLFGTVNGPGGNPIGGLINGSASLPDGAAISLFGSGTLGGTAFEVFVSALKQNSLARTLAEPTLVALSGEDAEFTAGGEIPVPVPQSGAGGGTSITVEYKEFGVKLKYNAVVLGDGRIRLKVEPEVSDLDYNNTVDISGSAVPGLTKRRAKTMVEMNEGQTLALAGLLQRRVNAKTSGTPLLSDIPIIGAFFRSASYERSETELVILVTPHLVSAMNPDQVPNQAALNWRYPNEAQLFGFADLGGPQKAADGTIVANNAPPRFVGPNGFDEPQPTVQASVATTDTK